jgi:hypothetical protein
MTLSRAAIGCFKELWKQHYETDLTDEQAQEYGERLIRVVETLLNPKFRQRERSPP